MKRLEDFKTSSSPEPSKGETKEWEKQLMHSRTEESMDPAREMSWRGRVGRQAGVGVVLVAQGAAAGTSG